MRPLNWPVWLEGPLLIAGTGVLCGLGYTVARRVPVLRGAIGISGATGPNRGPNKALACLTPPSYTKPNG